MNRFLNPAFSTLALSIPAALAPSAVSPAQEVIPEKREVKTHAASDVRYSILKMGTGTSKPEVGDRAVLHFREWLQDGTLLDGTGESKRNAPITITIGQERVPFGLSLAAQLVTKGGKIKLSVPPAKAYGAQGVPGKVPPNATILYEVELLDYQYQPKQARFIKGDPAKTQVTKSGLKYQVLQASQGERPADTDIVELEYTIWSADGQPRGGTYQFGKTVRAPIRGLAHPFLKEALPMMAKGAVWRCVVPENLTVDEIKEDSIWHIKLVSFEKSESLPSSTEAASTSTKSGLYYERLSPGKGERPKDGYTCELEWAFWKKSDKSFVAGAALQRNILITLDEKAPHKFLPEVLKLMQVGEVLRVEVPSAMTPPRMIPFDTVWRIKIVSMKEPLPAPKFYMPKPAELTKTASGLQYRVVKRQQEGVTPRIGQSVTVHYAGWLPDGTSFDSSYGRSEPTTFTVGQVIPGWNEGLQLMKPGESFLFVIPGSLAYGARGAPGIPPDATLVFHVELLKIGS